MFESLWPIVTEFVRMQIVTFIFPYSFQHLTKFFHSSLSSPHWTRWYEYCTGCQVGRFYWFESFTLCLNCDIIGKYQNWVSLLTEFTECLFRFLRKSICKAAASFLVSPQCFFPLCFFYREISELSWLSFDMTQVWYDSIYRTHFLLAI